MSVGAKHSSQLLTWPIVTSMIHKSGVNYELRLKVSLLQSQQIMSTVVKSVFFFIPHNTTNKINPNDQNSSKKE